MPRLCLICEVPLPDGPEECSACASLLRWFRGYFAHDLRPEELKRIGPQTRFSEDLGAESLDYMDWLLEAEEKLGVSIPDREAERLLTVGQFLRHLKERGASWPIDLEIRLARRGGCWRSDRWEAVLREPGALRDSEAAAER